ncbi:peptidyl-prolyl cis-trans isomerase [Paractinoplanes deccanensis]|uniref:Peptidyl-prolyl cis-trans isomerase n=1 Tax=Paractinoplanes deccanensis TaxID=113561 RepID=A0ABQ3YLD5_9ACTN|nr:peptidylprolyl isomerase [Actinoplanes deccanensis]GID80610.1 peptidyl-prolyl cis-trans isomerase [Actinoplanes deccanensis]
MSSIKDRQRAAARARLEKEMAERAAAARKRRQRQAVIGSAIAVVLIAGAAVWIVTALGKDDDKSSNTASGVPAGQVACTWTPDASGGKVKDVGTPPATVPNTGKDVLTIETNLGTIKADVDKSKTPCTAAAFEFLASKKFWDNTKCHRLVNEDKFKVLQCGDPFATGKGYRETDGQGGPSFTYAEENLPTDTKNPYPAGSIAMANTGQPGSTGSQFFIVSEDTQLSANYTLLGKISSGLDIIKGVVKAGDDGAFAQQAGGGHPKKEVDIKSLAMSAAS